MIVTVVPPAVVPEVGEMAVTASGEALRPTPLVLRVGGWECCWRAPIQRHQLVIVVSDEVVHHDTAICDSPVSYSFVELGTFLVSPLGVPVVGSTSAV